MTDVRLTRWSASGPPTESALGAIFREEGLRPSWWSNGPGERYAAHSHRNHKVLFCARGSIRFDLPASGESFELHAGDRLDIPLGTAHAAVVGPDGVQCVEAARSA